MEPHIYVIGLGWLPIKNDQSLVYRLFNAEFVKSAEMGPKELCVLREFRIYWPWI